MDEKKRYKFIRDSSSPMSYILDTLTGEKTNNFPHIANLLNQLCDVVERLRQQNKQLNVECEEAIYQKNFAREEIKSQENFLELLKQSQKQLAINELKKIEIKFNNFIENQIQKLEGE